MCTHSTDDKANSQSAYVSLNVLEPSRARVGLDHRSHNVRNGPLSLL